MKNTIEEKLLKNQLRILLESYYKYFDTYEIIRILNDMIKSVSDE